MTTMKGGRQIRFRRWGRKMFRWRETRGSRGKPRDYDSPYSGLLGGYFAILQGIILFSSFFCFPLPLLEEANDPATLQYFFCNSETPYLIFAQMWLLSLSLAHFNPAKSSKTLDTLSITCYLLRIFLLSPRIVPATALP